MAVCSRFLPSVEMTKMAVIQSSPCISPQELRNRMDGIIPEKAYFRIGEVSKILNVEPYVIRYWETEFKTVKPVRTKTAQRLYRKKDVEELLTIRNLLYRERFTISGAKKQLLKIRGGREEPPEACSQDKLVLIKRELQQIKKMMS
jgi:DNA-binding transcriptional MerR regulator